jgi:outer membrane protein assembly factor BamB
MPNRSLSILPLVALLLFLLVGPPATAADWPQWRGPDRDGRVLAGVENAWPDDLAGLERLWRIDVGKGYPGPIVFGDRVFVVETVDDTTEGARALDRATGKEIWKATWKGYGKVPFFAARNGDWVRSTPSYDGKTLYVGGMQELVLAIDGATGRELWRVDFPARYGTRVPDFGFSSSPLVDGDHLYVQASNSLIKLDKRTGESIWRTLVNDGDMMSSGAFSSPVLSELHGKRQLIVQTRTTLFGVDPKSGDALWSRDVPSFRGMNILTPVVHGDAVFTSTHRNNSFFFNVRTTPTETDAKTTAKGTPPGARFAVEQAWTHKVQGYMSTPVVVGDHIYMHLGNERLTCIDLRTGESRWTSEPIGKYWSLIAHDGKILALDSDGELHLVRADPEKFDLLASRQVADAQTWAHLAVAGEEIFVRELEGIAAYRWAAKTTKTAKTADHAAPLSKTAP